MGEREAGLFTSTPPATEIVSGLCFDARPTKFRFLPLGTTAQVWSEFGVVRINGTAQGYEQSIDFGQKTKKIFLEAPIQGISGNLSGVLFRE